jgi:hypothetical protein
LEKVKGKVVEIDTCRLCKKKAKLCNSHILPEFFYLDIYEDHRSLIISKEGEKVIQKGLREYLLCQQCETKLSRYEKYAKELIQKIPNFSRDENLGLLYSNDTDYPKFKLFQLSILWRASISSHVAFAQVNLGPHEEIIRRMLDEENPGRTTDYGCLMSTLLETELLKNVIQSPTRFKKKLYGHNAYKFVTGNITWVYVVSSHRVTSILKELFLQESGVLRVALSRHDEIAEVLKIARNLHRIEQGS